MFEGWGGKKEEGEKDGRRRRERERRRREESEKEKREEERLVAIATMLRVTVGENASDEPHVQRMIHT